MIRQQSARVDQLAALVEAKSLQVSQHKSALRRWRNRTLARPQTLIWMFAAGAWLGASRTKRKNREGDATGREKSSKTGSLKKALGIVNASVLTWRYLNKPLSLDSEL